MKAKNIKALLFGCFTLLTCPYGWGQVDSTKSVYNESVIVVGDYNPVLDGVTEKVNVAPTINELAAAEMQPKFTYSITPQRMTSLTSASGLKAAKVIGSPTRLYNNYLRLGLGHDFAKFSDFTPLLDFYYMSLRKSDFSYGLRLFHETDYTYFKANNSGDDVSVYGSNRQTVNKFDLFGKYILNSKHLFTADLSFDRQYDRFYGFSDSIALAYSGLRHSEYEKKSYSLSYNQLRLQLGAKSISTDVNKLGYEAQLALADLWGKWNFSQPSMNLDANVHYGFPMFEKYKAIAFLHFDWMGWKNIYDGATSADELPIGYTGLLPDEMNDGRHIITVNPYLDFLFNGFQVHAGVSLGFNAFDSLNTTTHNLFSDIYISKSFRNNNINLTFGFVGDYQPNDWNTLRLQNPYIIPAALVKTTIDDNLFAHLRVNFSKKLILNLTVDNHFYSNFVSFVPDSRYLLGNVYKPYYLDLNILDLAAQLTFVNDEMISMSLGMNYYAKYGKDEAAPPLLYHPNLTLHYDLNLNYKDKWLFGVQALLLSGMDADYSFNTTTNLYEIVETLPTRLGIRAHVEYIHNRALSFFFDLDNLTCHRYYLWAHYPASRFDAMLGLTYTFPTSKK